MMNHGVWRGRFQAVVGGKSRLVDSYHRAPLKIAKPFYGDSGEIILYMMDTSPGIFNGDTQEIDCTLEQGVHLLLTNQSSCKLQPSVKQAESRQTVRFRIGANAVLEYFPEPVVPFCGSDFQSRTQIEMEQGGQLFFSEILTPGRAGKGEVFEYKSYRSETSIYYNQQPIVFDCIHFQPKLDPACTKGLHGYTHMGTLYAVSPKIADLDIQRVRDLLASGNDLSLYAGVSALPVGGLTIRVLGYTACTVQQLLTECWGMLREQAAGLGKFRFRK
ncbi:urease accessory protein UreD [Fodinisporobacter ferrooxydans]|uniref:Urease accessory protein UreD n=1 Tax=Fodinisporobacter ferrooxydans TaxID=2901836 RepID=A0ABY4CHY3_9BACL|nr:urease accessory protein UreD [Alicyclobacillaceae bacterium MYW30-H2]